MRRALLAVAVVVGLVGAPACSGGGGDDDTYRLQVEGVAEVDRDGETTTVDTGEHDVAEGDTVRMVEGDAVLELPGDRSMRLRAGDERPTVIDVAAVPDVVDGDAVAVAGDDDLRFTVGDVDVRVRDGAARIQRSLSVTVAMYAGSSEVRASGRGLAGGLRALRQVTIPASGLLPRAPSPLLYDERSPDPWDREFLGGAIDLGNELDKRARGFTGQLGPRVTVDARLLKRVLPPLADEPALDDGRVGERSAGEALVGAAIVVAADGPFDRLWDDVFSFRAAGARWGLVALDQQVKRDALLGEINDAFGRSPLLFATGRGSGSGGGVAIGPTSTTTPGGGGQSPPPTTPPGDGGGGDDAPAPTVPPTTVPPDLVPVPLPTIPPPPGPQDPDGTDGDETPPDAVDVITDLVDDILGGSTTTDTTIPPLP